MLNSASCSSIHFQNSSVVIRRSSRVAPTVLTTSAASPCPYPPRRLRVELVVAKFQDGAKHCVCGRSVMNPGSVSAVAKRHGAEGDVGDRGFGHSNRLASLSIAAP